MGTSAKKLRAHHISLGCDGWSACEWVQLEPSRDLISSCRLAVQLFGQLVTRLAVIAATWMVECPGTTTEASRDNAAQVVIERGPRAARMVLVQPAWATSSSQRSFFRRAPPVR